MPPPLELDRLLIRGVNWLGDAILSTPALQRIREALPHADITLLTPRKLADLWTYHPAINHVIAIDENHDVWNVSRSLASSRFQSALIFPNSTRSTLECWLARIPSRIGYKRTWRSWLLTHPVQTRSGERAMIKRSDLEIRAAVSGQIPPQSQPIPIPPQAHHIHHYLHLAAALGASPDPAPPHIAVHNDELKAAAGNFALAPIIASGTPIIGVNPGAEYGPAKRWPPERFIHAANEISKRLPCAWLIFGGSRDIELAAQIEMGLRQSAKFASPPSIQPPHVFNLAGRTTLRQLAATLKLCRVVLTNDTGPMHLAAAVGTRVVALFGSTSPELTAPGSPNNPQHHILRHPVPCSPCFRRECPIDLRCMTGIQVQDAINAVLQALSLSVPQQHLQ